MRGSSGLGRISVDVRARCLPPTLSTIPTSRFSLITPTASLTTNDWNANQDHRGEVSALFVLSSLRPPTANRSLTALVSSVRSVRIKGNE